MKSRPDRETKNLCHVCLVGAGNIAQIHAEVLTGLTDATIAAVVDPDMEKAASFARRWRVPSVHDNVDAAIEAGGIDCAHILVPPAVHKSAAIPFLAARLPVLIEKPMATSAADCAEITALAASRGARVAVNHNMLFHPVFRRLSELITARTLGRMQSIQAVYSGPLRQLAKGQLGDWMFHSPLNLLLEQAIHPLSVIAALIGNFRTIQAIGGDPVSEDGFSAVRFYGQTSISLEGERAHAQLHFAVGRSFPVQQLIVMCDDGLIAADFRSNRLVTHRRTRWLDPVDLFASGERTAMTMAAESARNAFAYGASLLDLRRRSDPFFRSMEASIIDFHRSTLERAPKSSGVFGARMVSACESIAAALAPIAEVAKLASMPMPVNGRYDVAVLGGTGFIGRATVSALLMAGMRVRVLARHVDAGTNDRRVSLLQGDVRRRQDVLAAMEGVPRIVNLAHIGGSDWAGVQRDMVASAKLVADCCLELGARRLVHVSSIAALYLGDPSEVVTSTTKVDPLAERRAAYARGKAVTDRMLLQMHGERGLSVVILRPGVVVGAGGNPFHSGIGYFNNDQHCLGWNAGRNPIPFVLVEDVATAILLALTTDGLEGRAFNLAGDVRPTAREYIEELARTLERPLRFHPQSPWRWQFVEVAKWMVKYAGGHAGPFPSFRDLRSRGLVARIDCADVKRELGWTPVADRELFIRRGLGVQSARQQGR